MKSSLAILLLLCGCSSAPSYDRTWWVRDHYLVPESRIDYVDHVDSDEGPNFGALGSANLYTGVIQVQAGLSDSMTACVLHHERAHLRGWSHVDNKPRFPIDCGPTEE